MQLVGAVPLCQPDGGHRSGLAGTRRPYECPSTWADGKHRRKVGGRVSKATTTYCLQTIAPRRRRGRLLNWGTNGVRTSHLQRSRH
ncbi:MAG: hypothetical protein NZT92_02035 [Abditibacteriales bacterium]|nr:hypothetical protein [Abditibacteriales bacterium]MDW8364664.1 hypothetical protein [Abditibacteriales bacterium]